jgi:Flp pilus assembly protein TadD
MRADRSRSGKAQGSADLSAWADAHRANPADVAVARAYGRALRGAGARAEALAVLETCAGKAKDRTLTLERGLLTLELGQSEKAERLLRQADDPKAPDWRVASALGAALAARGKQHEAQTQFSKALALAPDHPSVLSNFALSLALDGKAEEAEALLRRARRSREAAPEVTQNLALVLGLRGRFEEAKSAASAALPAGKVSANLAYLKALTGAKTAQADTGVQAGRLRDATGEASLQLGGPN